MIAQFAFEDSRFHLVAAIGKAPFIQRCNQLPFFDGVIVPSVYFGAVVLRLLAGQLGKNSLLTPAVAGTAFLLPVLQKCVGAR